jgi:hypothetical protein
MNYQNTAAPVPSRSQATQWNSTRARLFYFPAHQSVNKVFP